ncbi:MAG: hypothetical protein KA224_03470 [Steroidobacteraceae bacterium]|nr:hypothetical protein [Steroidobacteraceae bacterium]MCC7198116.1 hypothetical protein [Gammaproteobacteria bacterium]
MQTFATLTATTPLEERRPRLLVDPFICFGPGAEGHTAALTTIVRRAHALGMAACVEGAAWDDARRDPDVQRRAVDLGAFEPLLRLPELLLPSARDLAARFQPARGEADVADLKLLGALHARLVDLVIAADGRLHRLATRAGFGARVLTPADAAYWLESLAGGQRPLAVREFSPSAALADPTLAQLIAEECEPFDPYLRQRLAAGQTRVFAAVQASRPAGLVVLGTAADGKRLEIHALTSGEFARGNAVLEPLVAAVINLSRKRKLALDAMLGPHDEVALALLEDLGFERCGRDRHGRELLSRSPEDATPIPAPHGHVWIVPLSVEAHDGLLPELAGVGQSELFAPSATDDLTTLGSAALKQLALASAQREPAAGDLVLTWHERADGRAAAGCLTSAMRVERCTRVLSLEEALPLTARRPGLTISSLSARLAAGPVTLFDLRSLGRLERLLPLGWLREHGILNAPPAGPRRLDASTFSRLESRLKLA